jgi:hypothetical protein
MLKLRHLLSNANHCNKHYPARLITRTINNIADYKHYSTNPHLCNTNTPMAAANHLIIGGFGAVGSVYSYHLQQANHKVTLFVKRNRVNQIESNQHKINLYDLKARLVSILVKVGLANAVVLSSLFYLGLLNLPVLLLAPLFVTYATIRSIQPVEAPRRILSQFDLISDVKQISPLKPDFVWFCVSSAILHTNDGEFIKSILNEIKDNQNTKIVILSPSQNDYELFQSLFPYKDRTIYCAISMLAYQAPLKDENWSPTHNNKNNPEGIAYFLPPLAPSLFSGPFISTQCIVAALTKGHCPAAYTAEDPRKHVSVMMSLMHPLLVGLQLSNWQWKSYLRNTEILNLSVEAARECIMIGPKQFNIKVHGTLVSLLLNRYIIQLVLTFLPFFEPVDVEAVIKHHFSKVEQQTIIIMKNFIKQGVEYNLSTKNTQALLQLLRQKLEKETKQSN